MSIFNVWIANRGRDILLSEEYFKRSKEEEGEVRRGRRKEAGKPSGPAQCL